MYFYYLDYVDGAAGLHNSKFQEAIAENNINSQTKQMTRNKSVYKRSQKQSEEDPTYDGKKPFYFNFISLYMSFEICFTFIRT